MPNFRGSANYGAEFRLKNIESQGFGDFDDVMSGVDLLVEQGIADPDRLGVMGWSYGGFLTAWVIGHTDRFKAASVGAPATDWITYYAQSDGPRSTLLTYFGGNPMGEARELQPALAAHRHRQYPHALAATDRRARHQSQQRDLLVADRSQDSGGVRSLPPRAARIHGAGTPARCDGAQPALVHALAEAMKHYLLSSSRLRKSSVKARRVSPLAMVKIQEGENQIITDHTVFEKAQ